MITPVDIQNKEFKSAVGGYKKEEVEEFLSLVQSEFDMLYRENIALKDKINMLSDAVKEYKAMETALQDTIVTAQSVAEEVKRTAQLTSENMLRETENKCKEMLLQSKTDMTHVIAKQEQLKQEYQSYKLRVRTMVESQLKVLDDFE